MKCPASCTQLRASAGLSQGPGHRREGIEGPLWTGVSGACGAWGQSMREETEASLPSTLVFVPGGLAFPALLIPEPWRQAAFLAFYGKEAYLTLSKRLRFFLGSWLV